MSAEDVNLTLVGSICITISCEIVPAVETGIAAVRSRTEPGVVADGVEETVTAGVVADAGIDWPIRETTTTRATTTKRGKRNLRIPSTV
jgi:hypothetical protein